jgi:hypothetical protein
MTVRELSDHDDIPDVIEELRTNYPLVSAILDRIPDMDIEEAGTVTLLVDGVRWLGKMHALRLLSMEDKAIGDAVIQSKINEIRTKYPLFGGILDKIHHMNLKETFTGLLVLDALEYILKAHQVQIVRERGLG